VIAELAAAVDPGLVAEAGRPVLRIRHRWRSARVDRRRIGSHRRGTQNAGRTSPARLPPSSKGRRVPG